MKSWKKEKILKKTNYYYDVYMAPDRTPDQQKNHKELVEKLKKRIKETPDKRLYIKNGEIWCDEEAKKVDVDRNDSRYYMFDTVH